MSRNGEIREKLKDCLREIFQFDKEELNFGIYRILKEKKREIENFIENELLNEIESQLNKISEAERQELENKKQQMESRNGVKRYIEARAKGDEERIRIYKEDFGEHIEEYEAIERQLEQIKVTDELEKNTYNHLVNFFSRYYDNGDFISLRKYSSKEEYVIPYNGEEVILYWANNDQYYIKTTELFKKYTFKKETVYGVITINFRVISAEEETGNAKSQEKKYFVLHEKVYDFDENNKELNIYFEYRMLTEEEKENYGNKNVQEKINQEITEIIRSQISPAYLARVLFEFQGEKTLFEKHLYTYTKRNTTDYFIHKDLKGFLEKELDFYIKNKLLQLDNLEILERSGYFDRLRTYFISVKAFRSVAKTIINFLAQIENFQKMIWEKKKFVINTHYVITLDKLREYTSEEFVQSILDEVLNNTKQLEEWKDLFDVEVKSENDLYANRQLQLGGNNYKKLPIDTIYFDEEFKWKLIVALTEKNELDDILDGILIKSENWQALNLLANKYRDKVQTIYIDPPFNTGSDFLYKDSYQDSTWLTLMENRIELAKGLLKHSGSIFLHLDDNANYYGKFILNKIMGEENFKNEIVWQKLTSAKAQSSFFSSVKDTLYFYSKSEKDIKFKKLYLPSDEEKDLRNYPYIEEETGRRYGLFDFTQNGPGDVRRFGDKILEPPEGKHWIWSQEKIDEGIKNGIIVFTSSGTPRVKRYLDEKEGNPVNDLWIDELVKPLSSNASERVNFQTQKPEALVKRILDATSDNGDIVLDFFLGSGTTTSVAQKLKRKWIGVEIGEYFWTIIIPRMKKVLFYDNTGISKEQDVREKYNSNTAGGFFKYHTLEQYEDALENVKFRDDIEPKLYELSDYFVEYFLEGETRESVALLNLNDMKNPFNYKLKVMENYEQKTVKADMIETFNYLLGLHVKGYKVCQHNQRKYVFVFGKKENKEIVIIWRDFEGLDLVEDKKFIEEIIGNHNIDELYINRDAVLSRKYKVIEPVFKRLMFEEV